MTQTTRFATSRTQPAWWRSMSEEPHSACLSRHIDVDKLDHLKTSGTETYNYDADGNRASVSVGATNYAYTYQANSNKLTNIAGPTAATYSLDPSGNVTATGGKTYAYDARGRLANITVGTVNSYGINGLGERVTPARYATSTQKTASS